MNNVTGYNAENVNALREVINSTAASTGTTICDDLKAGVITPMSTVWYAPEAVEFFEGFAASVAETGTAITEAFDGFRASIQSAGEYWAENTGGDAPVLAEIDAVELNLDVSAIQPNNAGNVVIDEEAANSVAGTLEGVEETIKTNLSGLAANLDAATAFMGHDQATALQELFVKVSESVAGIFKYLTEGDNNLKSQIEAAAQKYADVATNIHSEASNAGSDTISAA